MVREHVAIVRGWAACRSSLRSWVYNVCAKPREGTNPVPARKIAPAATGMKRKCVHNLTIREGLPLTSVCFAAMQIFFTNVCYAAVNIEE